MTVEHGPYDEFCAGFPYEETDDQQAAIDVVVKELAAKLEAWRQAMGAQMMNTMSGMAGASGPSGHVPPPVPGAACRFRRAGRA